MAVNSRYGAPPPIATPGCILIAGKVAIGATGAVGAQTGKGFTVTRTDTGDYTITVLSQGAAVGGVPAILYANASLLVNSDTQFIAQMRTAPTTGAITLTCFADAALGTPADPPSGASLQIFIIVKNVDAAR